MFENPTLRLNMSMGKKQNTCPPIFDGKQLKLLPSSFEYYMGKTAIVSPPTIKWIRKRLQNQLQGYLLK